MHFGVTGAVPNGSVGPKIATTGNPTADATCIAPESFPIKSWHRESSAGNSAIAVFPVKSIGFRFIPATIAVETAISPAVPNKIISASDSAINRFATSANRSGNQHFADPYEAPAPIATRGVPAPFVRDRTPAAINFCSAASASLARNRQRNLALPLNPLHPTRPPHQLQIIKLLVRRNLSRLRHRNRLRQQNPAPIPRIPNPLRNPRPPGQPSRIKRILQQQRRIKFLCTQSRSQRSRPPIPFSAPRGS